MKDRIRELMISQHMNQQSFAEALDISPASLSSIFNDRTKPTLNHIDAIKNKFPNINLDWLLYGTGPMFLDEGSSAQVDTVTDSSDESVLNFDDSTDDVLTPHPIVSHIDYNVHKEAAQRQEQMNMKIINNKQRNITEIRVFYDDQTWETFVPKN